MGSLPRPLPPPLASPRPAEALQQRCALAVRTHVCHACTCTLLLTNPNQPSLTATALRRPHVHTIPAPCAPAYRVPTGLQDAGVPPQRAVSAADRQPFAPSPRTPTLSGGPRLATAATTGCGSTTGERGRAAAAVTAVASLSAVR